MCLVENVTTGIPNVETKSYQKYHSWYWSIKTRKIIYTRTILYFRITWTFYIQNWRSFIQNETSMDTCFFLKPTSYVYVCLRYQIGLCFYDFNIWFWNCFDIVVFFVFHFILMDFLWSHEQRSFIWLVLSVQNWSPKPWLFCIYYWSCIVFVLLATLATLSEPANNNDYIVSCCRF